jgi:hypothetical protein
MDEVCPMEESPYYVGQSAPWPYKDLQLKTPNCPYCGAPGMLLVGANLYPMGWCPTEDCKALSWDPSKAALELLRDAVELEEPGND